MIYGISIFCSKIQYLIILFLHFEHLSNNVYGTPVKNILSLTIQYPRLFIFLKHIFLLSNKKPTKCTFIKHIYELVNPKLYYLPHNPCLTFLTYLQPVSWYDDAASRSKLMWEQQPDSQT